MISNILLSTLNIALLSLAMLHVLKAQSLSSSTGINLREYYYCGVHLLDSFLVTVAQVSIAP